MAHVGMAVPASGAQEHAAFPRLPVYANDMGWQRAAQSNKHRQGPVTKSIFPGASLLAALHLDGDTVWKISLITSLSPPRLAEGMQAMMMLTNNDKLKYLV
ncbi:hypothetical protein P7K49_001173 [Saguinus oedipus]|uniref:Uncharacterized protein n=1 Tax=Saguinus oedipus TaxID=9490 RepID=A0ABQ9WDQ2_SAGOE|nr:hypothetical protein P7K49_001173 [Saguinus oedipus]